MIVVAIENFIFFSSLLAVGCFVFAWMVRGSVSKGWCEPHPLTLARVYAAAAAAGERVAGHGGTVAASLAGRTVLCRIASFSASSIASARQHNSRTRTRTGVCHAAVCGGGSGVRALVKRARLSGHQPRD